MICMSNPKISVKNDQNIFNLHDTVTPEMIFCLNFRFNNTYDVFVYTIEIQSPKQLKPIHNQSRKMLSQFIFPAATSILGDLVPAIACVHSSIVLHRYILTNILRLPLAFFETTPVGRVLARFSKDIDVVDNQLPRQLTAFLGCLFKVRSNV